MTSIIQSNRERKSKLDNGLVERLNNEASELKEVQNTGKIDEAKKSIPTTTFKLPYPIAIRTPTQKDYDDLMQFCESFGLRWNMFSLRSESRTYDATDYNAYRLNGEDTFIDIASFEDKCISLYYLKNPKYAKKTDIFPDMNHTIFNNPAIFFKYYHMEPFKKQLNEWFSKYKPNRFSKG